MKQKKSLGRKILREILRLLYKLCSRLWTYAKGGKPMSKAEIAQDKADYRDLMQMSVSSLIMRGIIFV